MRILVLVTLVAFLAGCTTDKRPDISRKLVELKTGAGLDRTVTIDTFGHLTVEDGKPDTPILTAKLADGELRELGDACSTLAWDKLPRTLKGSGARSFSLLWSAPQPARDVTVDEGATVPEDVTRLRMMIESLAARAD